ncbi:MAG: HNH endonuclease [Xenococcaceae cyanobacterium]
MHSYIYWRLTGDRLLFDEAYSIDHINHNPLDNRIANLRLADSQLQGVNRRLRKDNTSGYKGVRWRKDRCRWQASIKINGKIKYLGVFENVLDASLAYVKAHTDLYGFPPVT